MQFPESWLRTFVDPQLTTDELSHALTMAGLEVESLSKAAPPTSKIVVGRVLEVVKHPDADKLNVCQVDAGTGATLNIVCGAPNVAPGIKVPVALVGAELPPAEEGGKPFAIKLSKLRGVESQGMLCSARELKLSEDHSGLLVLPDPDDGDALAQDPRTWVPAYLGPSGWLGIDLDRSDTDWDEVAELLDASYRRVARATLLARLDGDEGSGSLP